MKKVIAILVLFVIYVASHEFYLQRASEYSDLITLTGIVLISAYFLALLLKNVNLPKLTGYMVLGIIIGPVGLNFLDHEKLLDLKFLESMALSFIAVTAGGEFKYSRIKKYTKTVVALLSGQLIFVFFGLLLSLIIFSEYIPFFSELDQNLIVGFAILFAGTAVSKSPATTMGIITELKARGKITNIVLSVTVLKSILLVLFFPALLMWSKIFLIENTTINLDMLSDVAIDIFSSVVIGAISGFFIIWYLKFIKAHQSIFLLGIIIIITEASSIFSVDILLTSMIAGIIVENFSDKGESLILNIEKSSLPFYIIFFSFAGAGLHLGTLQKAFVLTLFLVATRLLFLYFGNWLGSLAVKEDQQVKQLSWLGFVGQAGIAVGLGTIIENTFPGDVGTTFKTILVSSVVINELIGPILLKYLLVKTREAQIKG